MKEVFILVIGDGRHGDAIKGAYSTMQSAIDSMPSHIELHLVSYGGKCCILTEREAGWYLGTGGISVRIHRLEVKS